MKNTSEKENEKKQGIGTGVIAGISVVYLILGLAMLFVPAIREVYIVYMLCAVLIAFGILTIVRYFTGGHFLDTGQYSFSGGVLAVIAGFCIPVCAGCGVIRTVSWNLCAADSCSQIAECGRFECDEKQKLVGISNPGTGISRAVGACDPGSVFLERETDGCDLCDSGRGWRSGTVQHDLYDDCFPNVSEKPETESTKPIRRG